MKLGEKIDMKVCFIDAGIFISDEKLIKKLKNLGEVEIYYGIPKSVEEVVERGRKADIIVFGMMQFTNEMLDRLKKLKILQFMGTGVNNFVDIEYAKTKGIKVLKIDGYGSNAVAEFAVSMGMAALRKITACNDVLKANKWTIEGLMGSEIKGAVVGVYGTGSIGRLVAQKYHALGAKVIASDIYENKEFAKSIGIEYVSPQELFRQSDLVTVHMIVTDENKYGIDKKYFDSMKAGACFINVARAELVNGNDLFDALVSKHLSYAAIDVYYHEPPNEADYRLAKLDNVIATPHLAYYTQQANDNAVIMTVDSIIQNL